jgi:hypothetical protein
MQGHGRQRLEGADARAVAGHLLAPGSVFAFLAGHRGELFPDAMFEDLFPSGLGRPSVPADVMASVLVLQALCGLSDREAAEAVTFDLRWKAACGYAVTDPGFHPSTLTYWRRRLAASTRPHRIFEAVSAVVAETGVLAGRTRRVLDSTVLDDAVATQDTITQLIACIRRFARDVPEGKDLVAAHARGYDYTRAGKPDIAWDDAEARDGLVSVLVADAAALLAAVDPTTWEEDSTAAQAHALLALVAGQDVEPATGSDGTDGRWRIARKVAPDRVVSVVDPDARHAHKSRSRQQDGYKAHLVVEPDTGLVTAAALTKACGPGTADAQAGAVLLAADPAAAGGPLQVLADSAYGTAPMLRSLTEAGHRAVIKPWPLNRPIPGGFTLDDFTHDAAAGTITCPHGQVRTVSAKGWAKFGSACAGCPLRARCTRSAEGRRIRLHPEHELLQAHRAAARDPGFRADYRQHRPMVERTIAWAVRGNRRVPYRGVARNHAWWLLRTAAVNLKRLLNLGLSPRNGSWALT